MSELDNITITRGEGGNYESIPEDVYEVMIESIEPKKVPEFNDPSKERLVLNFKFDITEGEYTGSKLFRRITPHISIEKPSNLYKLVCAVEGKKVDGDYFDTFKPSTLLGKLLRVTVKNVTKGENTYSNVESFLASKLDEKKPAKKVVAPSEDITEEDIDSIAGEL